MFKKRLKICETQLSRKKENSGNSATALRFWQSLNR